VVRTLAPRLEGRRIVEARFSSRFVTPGNRAALARRVRGRTVTRVYRRGKFIVCTLDQGELSVHLGMTGKLLFDAAPSPHTHAVFELDTGALLFDDPRQFGRIEWGAKRASRLGPEPLDVTLDDFLHRLALRKTRLKALLLNQTFLAGIGNIYADEILFAAGLYPRTIASRLRAARATRLYRAMREVLSRAIERRGSSISDYVDAEGRPGAFQLEHCVYGREGQPCVNCGSAIRKITISQRGTHYCPKCQRS